MSSSKLTIYTALIADLLIAAVKFIAASVTGSAAMVSEGVHSLIDTVNEILLLIGIRLSRKPADEHRPFGYGKELYFWSFIVSLLLFSLGGTFSIYQGILHLRHPLPLRDVTWNYIVLGVAFVFTCFSIAFPLRAFNRERGRHGFWSGIIRSKDPATFVVLLEDSGGLIGIIIAFLGVWLGHILHNPYLDGIASLLIGAVLVVLSILLTMESRSLLMGEPAAEETLSSVIRICEDNPSVDKVKKNFSMYLSPDEIVLQLNIAFKEHVTSEGIVGAIEQIEQNIREQFPRFRQIFIQPVKLENEKDYQRIPR